MASINLEKVKTLYGNSTDLQGQFIDYLRNVESELDFSKFEGLDNQAIFTNLMESGQKEIKVNPNNPAKPLNYRPRREQTYKELKPLDDEIKNQPFYKDLAMRATQVLDQINPTPFRQKELEARRHKAQEILNHLKRSGVTSEQFAKEYGDSPFLREAYFENQDIFSNIFDLSHDTSAALFGGKNAQAKAYDFELESYNTYKTLAQRKLDNPSNYYKLTPQERKIIDQRLGAFSAWWHNDSDKEKVDLYLDRENAKESASNFVSAQKRLENVNSNEQFLGLIGALKHGKEFDKKQKAMIDDYAIVAKELGFDTLAYNKTGLYFIKDEKAYKVEQGLWDEIKGVFKDNIGSLAGAIAGAEYGYKKGKFKGMVVYGAAGAFGGGVTDSMIADVLANKKIDLAQALLHGAQEGALNIAADAVLKVAGTAIKTLNPEKLKNIAGTAIDYTPVLGFAKRAKDGNTAAAQKLIDHAIPQEAQADLKALESIFGAEVQIGATKTSQAQSAINALQNKLGSDSYIVKGAKSLYDTFAFTSQKQAQKDFIRAIRADESGNLSAFLSEAANASPVIQKNLLNILHQTSQKLAHQLGRFDLPPSTIKDVFDNFEKGTKQSYTDAIEQILLKVYDESYTTTLAKDSPNIPSNLSSQEAARFNTDSLESFKAKMEKSGILLEDSAKFLRFVESTIYNPKGVTFETLNNAQKTLNAYYKQATDPNFRNFVKDAVNGFIKRDIQAGIEKIFAQNAPLYNDARTLFDTALSDYAKMKETLKLADSLKIRDRRRSYEQVAQSLSRFFLGQGDNIPNFEALLGGLQKELREQVELKLLQDMLELSFVKLNDIKVLDSSEFFKRLDPLKGYFASTSAKDFIKIAQDFHTLFRNDASIARSLSPATTEKIGTSIATTLEGAVKFQVIKALFANIIRLMPHIPFAKKLNESVQGSALRYQLKKALDSSLSVGEFKLELQARAIKGDFTNTTREQIAKILGQVENAQESLERATTPSTQAKDTLESQASKEASTPNPAETPTQKVDSSVEHFGQNFSEFKGQGAKAVEKVLQERSGQVQGAFYRDELGEIDVVWGEITDPEKHKGYGLAHILDKRKAEFMQQGLSEAQAEAKAIDFTKNEIANIIENGKITNKPNEATKIETPAYKLILKQNWKGEPLENKWLVTAYIKNEKGESISSTPFTKGDNLPLNSSGNSTTLSPLEQAQAQKQAEQAAQEATKLAQRQADQETAQAIKDRNDQIQHLKDSRAGKSEMEREVQLGQPIAMKRTEQPPTSIATDDNNIYQLDFVIVKASDVKPNFNADGLQPRTQKEHKTIESIAQNFKPEMVLGRGGYKDLPIIAKDGQVITGNHRVQGFKDFTQESRAAYEKAIKDRFNIELASDELLLRTPSDDLSVKELLSIAYNSNKEDIKNLGDHIYSVLGRYAPNFAKLPRQLESSSVQELKSKIARILDPSPYPNENDANLALLANTIKADKNANITEMLNAFSKLDKEDAARTLNTFTDTAGLWHILSNNAVEYGLKQLDLRPYLLGAMYKSAVSQHTTRAANFKELNAQIKHILDTTDSSGSNMMLAMMPNTYDNLIADLLGASLARFMRLENPSANLYEALKGANSGIREQLAPRLDFEIGFTTGRNIEQADIFDFIEYMIREGGEGKEVAEAVELLPKLREKYNAFKASTPPPSTPTPPHAPKVDSSVEKPANKPNTTPKKSQREQVKQQLQSIKNIDITHKSGIVARLSSTGIDKMLSDKAIQKSLDNGFSQEQHFSAVADIERLFKNSDFSHTEAPKNQSADIVGIHRYINAQDLQDQNAQALITLKESVENGNRIYSVELEGLAHPSSVDRSPKSKGVENSHHDDAGATKAARLFENPSDTIPQKSLMNYTLLDNNLVEAIGQKIFRNYNKPYKERMSEIRDFFSLPKEHFTKILDKYKREVNSLEKGEIYNKIATTMSIDEITDEITRSLKIKRERGYAAQAEKYFNELEEKAFHISKILQDMPYQIRDFIQNSAIDYKAAQWQKLLNTLDRLITRNNEIILENVQIRHKEYVKKFKNLATRNFSLWKNINALLNKEGIREVGDTLEVRNKNILDSIFKQTTPPNTPTPPHTPKVDSSVEATPPKDTLESQAVKEASTSNPAETHTQKGLFDEVDSSLAYTDTKGHTHQIPTDIAQKWLETFGLKDLQETYTPQFSEQVAKALESTLQGEQITLSANSLVKLMQRDRLEFLPYIKETLEAPNAVVRQVDGALIFAKDYRDEKLGKFFASVSKNDQGEWIISSNAPKNLNNLHNKIKEGGEVLYSDLPELPIIAKPDLTAKALNSEANQGDIIPQPTQEIIKQAKEQGKSVAETAENNTNAWQKEFIEKIKNDESGEILGHYTQGEALVIERKINDKDLDLISITKGENGELFATYLGKFITRQEAQKRKSFLDNGFKGKEKELLEFLEKEPVNIGSERIAFIPPLDKFFGISSFNGEYFTEFFIHKHFADSKEPFTSMSLGQRKLEAAKDNLGRYIDKLFKDNGHPFGFLINNKKTMQRLAKDKELYKVKGKGAIETLLTAKMGHIQGAFHRKELGDIDLVWGDSSFGLAHIIERRMQDFINQGMGHEQAEQAVKELLDKIPQILEGQIYKDSADKVEIITDKYTLVIGKRDDRKFIITELIDRRNEKRMEAMQTRVGDSFTDEPLAKSPLSSNRSDSTTKTFNQADIKLESLSDFSKFARLAGFGDLSEQELERAHKHILTNLEKLRC